MKKNHINSTNYNAFTFKVLSFINKKYKFPKFIETDNELHMFCGAVIVLMSHNTFYQLGSSSSAINQSNNNNN